MPLEHLSLRILSAPKETAFLALKLIFLMSAMSLLPMLEHINTRRWGDFLLRDRSKVSEKLSTGSSPELTDTEEAP
jgi:hypothetical protein